MKKILIRTKETTFFIGLNDVLYCKAAGSYSVIYLIDSQEIVTSVNLLNLQERMKYSTSIFRVSQSFLVNMNFLRCIHHGTKEIELLNRKKIPYTVSIKELEQALLNFSSN